MNGWQRLWLVGTVVTWLVVAVFMPMKWQADRLNRYDQSGLQEKLESDVYSGKCSCYMTEPFSSLPQPEYQGACYYLYTARAVNVRKAGDIIPFNLELLDTVTRDSRVNAYWSNMGVLSIITLIGSALVYLAGLTIRWIAAGF